jgi:hypothetical protein
MLDRLRIDRDGDLWIAHGGQWYCIWEAGKDPDDNDRPFSSEEAEQGFGPLLPVTFARVQPSPAPQA